MHRYLTFALLVIAFGAPVAASSQDARSILETSQQKQLERWKGVDVYVVVQSIVGQSNSTYFQRTDVTDSAGKTQTIFLPVRQQAIVGECGPRSMTPDELEIFAQGAELTGTAVGIKHDERYDKLGIPKGLRTGGGGSEPWAALDPRTMMNANAEFLRAAADAKREMDADDPKARGRERIDQISMFVDQARLVGTESIDGRRAFHLRATGIGHVQESDGNTYTTDAISMWIDSAEYVPLHIKMDGTMTSRKESRPYSLEIIHADYRRVPDSNMYESYKQTMKMSGMLDAKQQKEMQQAQKQMEDLEKQLASMPASQRTMMERMVGPQLEQFRNMAAGGGIQMETVTNSITVNPKITGPDGKPCGGGSAAVGGLPDIEEGEPQADVAKFEARLLVMIQEDLIKMGYTPGNTKGELDKLTVVAISQFQAKKGLEVTGLPSPQLAGIIAVDANPEPDP